MEPYLFAVIFFALGYAIGRFTIIKTLKKENEKLRKEQLILRNHITSTKKGRIIIKGKEES